MKILLISPPIENTIASIMPKALEEGLDFLPPLGLMYIAGFLEKETSHKVEILDAPVENISHEHLKEEIKKRKPNVIGITAMTFTLIDVIKVAKNAKSINPNIKIVLGGPHVVIYPKETIDIPEIDFLVLGEGEQVIKQLLENINNPKKLKEVKGLVFKDGGEIVNTGMADPVKDINNLPFPARHLTPFKKYFSVVSPNKPVTTMFTSRGCPYNCLFCDRPAFGKSFRPRSAKNVVDEFEQCQKMGIKEIFIYDDTFAVDKNRVLEICAEIKKRKIVIAWDIRTRVNTVDEEIITALKDAGCQRIHFGVEAGTQRILNVLRKGITLEMAEKAFRMARKAGIQTLGYFMIGSPTETKEDILETVKFMKKLNPDYAQTAITTPFPGTDLYKMAIKEKVLSGDVWQKFAQNTSTEFIPPVWDKEISKEELKRLLKKAYKAFYFRPNFIIKKISQLNSWDEFKNKTRAAWQLFKL